MKSTTTGWRTAGWMLAVGTVVLFIGLMTGPTPGADSAGALRNIDEQRTRYVVTNLVDMVGAFVMLAGFAVIARVQLQRPGTRVLAVLGAIGTIIGCAFFELVLVLETAVDPALARRFVESGEAEAGRYLAIAESVFDFETGLFGLTLLLILWGAAALGLCAWRDREPRLPVWFVIGGVAVCGVAGLTAPAYNFEALKVFGRLEPVLSILALLWITAFGVVVARRSEG